MIYFDNSATTIIYPEVRDYYVELLEKFPGNPNAHHALGHQSHHLIEQASQTIAQVLGVHENELVYVSSASEANNTVINTILETYRGQVRHVITSLIEHPSMTAPLARLQKEGFIVDTVHILEDGTIDEDHFRELLSLDPVLVSLIAVESETGLTLAIDHYAYLTKQHSKAFFHTDMTQGFQKVKLDLRYVDYATMSAHKIGGPKGIALLMKKNGVPLKPLIYGGHSTTKYRASTPVTELIGAFAKAVEINRDLVRNQVEEIRAYLIDVLCSHYQFEVNQASLNSPYILNLSHPKLDMVSFQRVMSEQAVYFSLRSACSSADGFSQSVLSLTNSMDRATHCMRLSFSPMNTLDEAKTFIERLQGVDKEHV